MRKRRFYLLLIGVLVVMGVLIAVLSRPAEPEYQGRRLSDWIIIYASERNAREEAKDAISHVGTNALPWLVKWIQYEPPPWKIKLNALLGKRFSWWRRDEQFILM